MRANIDGIGEAIQAELQNWAKMDVQTALNYSLAETAEEAAKMLRQGGPYEERTGKYTKGWTSGQRTTRASAITGLRGYSVYNEKRYQLTHLLENGHQSRNGGRTRAFSHIEPVNDRVYEIAKNKLEKRLGG